MSLDAVAGPRPHDRHRGVARRLYCELHLAHADGFEDRPAITHVAQGSQHGRGGGGQPAEVAAGRQRPGCRRPGRTDGCPCGSGLLAPPWLVLLLRDSPADTHWLDYALAASTWPNEREQLLLLFDHFTEPTAELAPSFGLGSPRLGVYLRGNDHWLLETWTQRLKPDLHEAAHAVVAIADRHLRRIRDLQVGGHPGNLVSVGRSAIEPHPQDRYTDGGQPARRS